VDDLRRKYGLTVDHLLERVQAELGGHLLPHESAVA